MRARRFRTRRSRRHVRGRLGSRGRRGGRAKQCLDAVTAGAAPTSASVSATGIQVQNAYDGSNSATVNVPGGAGSTAPINITPAQGMSYTTGGWASTVSGAACSGAACGSAPAEAGGATQAASGAAQAQGVVAQNNVKTNANVAVKVGGQNFAPITVIINSITQIFNWGAGSATSGDAVSNGSGDRQCRAGDRGQRLRPGDRRAGRQLGCTALVDGGARRRRQLQPDQHHDGPGRQPGELGCRDGDVRRRPGKWSRRHRHQRRRQRHDGLQAMNLVSMWADANVDIDGNNYAPIYIRINFTTNIDNLGYAGACSGNVAAGQPASAEWNIHPP